MKRLIALSTVIFLLTGLVTGCVSSSDLDANKSELKADSILAEQKEKSETITKAAVSLITEDKMTEVKNLYQERWDELARLRTEVLYDPDLTKEDKARVDKALKADEDSVTRVLSKYEQLWP